MKPDRFTRTLAARGISLEPAALEAVLTGPIARLLTTGNPKTAKGEKQGYLTAILHLAPALQSGFQMCPKATAGCSAACLNTAGRGAFDSGIPAARNRRTWQFMLRRPEFMDRLVREISNHCARAETHGLKPAVRLNGTSDIRWERVPCSRDGQTYPNLMDAFPNLQFYDYTKLTGRTDLPPNYHLTFSAADGNDRETAAALEAGMSVAMVFRSAAIMDAAQGRTEAARLRSAGIRMRSMPLPATYHGRPIVDGDKSDLRFLDPPAAIVALRAKGKAVLDTSGFVRDLA